jgi:hypothetical protein
MDYIKKITGSILIIIGLILLIISKLDFFIGGLIFIIFGLIIFFNKFENKIEQIKGDKK